MTTPSITRTRSTPFAITVQKTTLQDIENLLCRFKTQSEYDPDTNQRVLGNLMSRLNGRSMNHRNPSNQLVRQHNGGGSSTDLLQIRTEEEYEALCSAVEWGLEASICPHIAQDLAVRLTQ